SRPRLHDTHPRTGPALAAGCDVRRQCNPPECEMKSPGCVWRSAGGAYFVGGRRKAGIRSTHHPAVTPDRSGRRNSPMTASTPASLLHRLGRSPESRDWERFVELYTPLLFAWTGRLGLSDHDAA